MKNNADTPWVPNASESTDCVLCGGSGGPVLGTMGRHNVPVRNVACRQCGLVYVTPRPSQDDMAEFYRFSYRTQHLIPHKTADGRQGMPGTEAFDEAMVHRGQVLGTNALELGKVKPGDRVLDVGCRQAIALRAMREQVPIEAVGIEPGENDAAVAQAHGVQMHAGVMETYDPGGHLFDQVQMLHVLEHIHDPLAALVTLRSFLKPDGRLVICVPDVLQPYGGLKHFFQYPHLFSFSPNTLMGLFRRAGLRPTTLMRGGVIWLVGVPEQGVGPLPTPYAEQTLPQPAHNGAWVANRLLTYEGLESARRLVKAGHPLPLDLVVRLYGRPGLPEHLVSVTTDLLEMLSAQDQVGQAVAILEAAANGPHSEAFRDMCRELLARLPQGSRGALGAAAR